MHISESLQSEINYSRKLVEAGLDGGRSSAVLRQEFGRSVRSAWLPVVAGAAVGLLAAHFGGKRKTGRGAVWGALAGGALGFGGSMAWSSRAVTSKVFRTAGKNLHAVRDEHWLEKHPISYA